jgi:ribulose-phosphate 3-epimerase
MIMSHLIAPSLLSADFSNLKKDIEMVNDSEADWFHLDIMDGHFVPNISFGIPVVKSIKKYAKKTLDVHLMITNPEDYIEKFIEVGADIITIHVEACKEKTEKILKEIKRMNIKTGLAINPDTNFKIIEKYIDLMDIVCLMGVFPGFGGQKIIDSTFQRCKGISEIITKNGVKCLLEVDGGVTAENAKKLLQSGADVLVAGSYVFRSKDPKQTISELKNI